MSPHYAASFEPDGDVDLALFTIEDGDPDKTFAGTSVLAEYTGEKFYADVTPGERCPIRYEVLADGSSKADGTEVVEPGEVIYAEATQTDREGLTVDVAVDEQGGGRP